MKKHMRYGFTLVEVLIIVAILSILGSIGYMSYQAYIKNAKQTQIATSVDAGIGALKAYALEKNVYPSDTCLPSGSYCCYRSPFVSWANAAMCARSTNTDITKYMAGSPTYLPHFDGMYNCSTANEYTEESPCTTNGSERAGIHFTHNNYNQTGLYGSSDSSVNGFITYYIDGKYKCVTDNLYTITAQNPYGLDEHLFTLGPADTGATYSAQFTDSITDYTYNECIIAIK